MFAKMKKGLLKAILLGVVIGIVAWILVWVFAPEVGGSWWPYIRFGVATLSGIIVGKTISTILWFKFVMDSKDDLMEKGMGTKPWSEEEIENTMNNFEDK